MYVCMYVCMYLCMYANTDKKCNEYMKKKVWCQYFSANFKIKFLKVPYFGLRFSAWLFKHPLPNKKAQSALIDRLSQA